MKSDRPAHLSTSLPSKQLTFAKPATALNR